MPILLQAAKQGTASSAVVLDGVGRPLRYERKGRWKTASHRLRSDGYNGKIGGDDLRLSAGAKLARAADAAISLRRTIRGKGSGAIEGVENMLRVMITLRCADELCHD